MRRFWGNSEHEPCRFDQVTRNGQGFGTVDPWFSTAKRLESFGPIGLRHSLARYLLTCLIYSQAGQPLR